MQVIVKGPNGQKAALSGAQLVQVEDLIVDLMNGGSTAEQTDQLIVERLSQSTTPLLFGQAPIAASPELTTSNFSTPPEL